MSRREKNPAAPAPLAPPQERPEENWGIVLSSMLPEDRAEVGMRKGSAVMPLVSIAAPVFNEQDVLPEFLRRAGEVLDQVAPGRGQIILVNDGSRDATAAILEQAAARDPRIRAIHLSRNFGHQAAITAALDYAQGDAVVVMDADLQDAPEQIARFLAKRDEGFDVVYAIRATRREGPLKKACYWLYYRTLDALSENRAPLDAGDFALLTRPVVEQMKRMREQKRYLRGLRHWTGFRQTGLEVDRDPRHAGETKYSVRKLFKLAFDGVFSFSVAPLRAMSIVGAAVTGAAVLYASWAVWAHYFDDTSPQGFTTLIVAMVFLSGVQMMFLGVIGEYLGRVYEEVKGRPLYVVARVSERGEAPEHDAGPAPERNAG